jgi:hypothetical protein
MNIQIKIKNKMNLLMKLKLFKFKEFKIKKMKVNNKKRQKDMI